MVENAPLKAQLGGIDVPPQVTTPPKIYPYPPLWMSYTPPYMMKRQGSQVPLVLIPKLKSQALAPTLKISKKLEKKNMRYGGMRKPFMSGKSFVSGFYEKHHGRVLTNDGHLNGIDYFRKYGAKDHSLHCRQGGQGESNQQNSNMVVDEFVLVGNGSDPLAASLYVPRNDKLVEIDGNLIIQSILESVKDMASHRSVYKKNRELGLTVP
ncbi:hypothetical protein RDI58_010759 [Solanum bulbocastanum]|uniref:Uncharacterized protein n=1 Tax=Solanum bulbocastanum TaxID=147425 RepID=A0AAN8TVD7_SOLBU